MAKLLFSLRQVPDDEADAIRELLRENNIDFYETAAGNWGISAPGIWLKEKDEHPRAKDLLEEFQQSWNRQQQDKHQQLAREGNSKSFIDGLKQNPLQVIIYIAIVLLVLYLSTKPFISLGN